MFENYKQETYLKITTTTIRTIGELHEFVINNIKLSDDELISAAKKYVIVDADEKYIKHTIRTFKRKYKLDKLLNEKNDI